VKNFVWLEPKPTKKIVHVGFLNGNAGQWKDRFEEAGVPVKSPNKRRVWISVTPDGFKTHEDLIREAIVDTIQEFGA
jgi:hypothetical protein